MIEFRQTQIEAWINGVRVGSASQTAPNVIRVSTISSAYVPQVETMDAAKEVISEAWNNWLSAAKLEEREG